MVVAAYARDLLCRTPFGKSRLKGNLWTLECELRQYLHLLGLCWCNIVDLDIWSDLGSLLTKVDGMVHKEYGREQENILTWFKLLDYTSLQNDLISRKQEGTGVWLSDSPEYQQWESTKGHILFCPGIWGHVHETSDDQKASMTSNPTNREISGV